MQPAAVVVYNWDISLFWVQPVQPVQVLRGASSCSPLMELEFPECCPGVRAGPCRPNQQHQTPLPGQDHQEKRGNDILRAALFPQADEYSIKHFGKQFARVQAAALYGFSGCQEVLLEPFLKIVVLIRCSECWGLIH